MRWLAALLLLAGCGSKSDDAGQGGETPAAPDAGIGGAASLTPAQLQGKAAAALAGITKDPRFGDLRAGPLNAVCGMVDSKLPNGKYAGFRPFLVTPEGVAVISVTSRVMFDDPADPFPDLYLRWCATPEEMQTIGPMIAKKAEVPPPAELPPETIDPVPEGNWGVVPGAAPPPPPAPKAAEAPPAAPKEKAPPPPPPANRQPGDEDSFLKSVLRPQEPKAGN
jgi:hypothetical protein